MYRKHKTLKAMYYILNHLRKEDKEEIKKLFGKNWKKQVIKTHRKIDFDVVYDKKTNRPFIMGGINIVDKRFSDIASAWMLATPLFAKHKYKLAKEMIKELKQAQEKYFYIFNDIYKSNYEAKNFALKIGFKTVKSNKEDWEHIFITKKMKGLS